MKIGALIVTTGLPRISGVTALLSPVGSITAGQRMISSLQCAGVCLTGVVVGQEEKKGERQLAQNGVIFLRCSDPEPGFFRGVQHGLSFMGELFDRIVVVPGDLPLFSPQTVQALCGSQASIALPENYYGTGYPIVLDRQAVKVIAAAENADGAKKAVQEQGLLIQSLPVKDPGITLRDGNMNRRDLLIRQHNAQLSRPVTDVLLCGSGAVYDPRLSMLLHLVELTRSVRDACSLMQMSYSTAWNMLNDAESELGYPLVMRIRGGPQGSGSVLTPRGKALMDAYDRFSLQLQQEAQRQFVRIFGPLAEEDR